MATVTPAAVAIPSFTGLKSAGAAKVTVVVKVSASPRQLCVVKSSLKDVGVAEAATAANTILASSAMAIEVLLGGDDGSSISPGEKIVFKNNAGFPHNIVFDEDEFPSDVDAGKMSMPEEDLLDAPGETYAVTLTEKGSYAFYCATHEGAGMASKVTVN